MKRPEESTDEPAGKAGTGEPAPPSGGDRAARYALGREIGRGGLGRVVEARDAELERDVAVKLVLDGVSAEMLERFLIEARVTAGLEHPNIVPVHDLVRDADGRVMLCMKRVQGRDLGSLIGALARGDDDVVKAWSRARLLRVFQDICLGIAFAHDRGVIHRDLKPSNVMIGDYGETLIVDWGLAKRRGAADSKAAPHPPRPPGRGDDVRISSAGATVVRGDGAGFTIEGSIVGTPAYMPPEQAEGRIADIDERSDIYALGAILYEMLALRPPVEGDSIDEVITRVRIGEFPAPSRRASVQPRPPAPVPPELDAICMKALALRREDRFPSARALHDDIQLFLEGVKQRERERRLADEFVARAHEAIARHGELDREIESAHEVVERGFEAALRDPLGDKAGLWSAEDREQTLRRQSTDAFTDADRNLTLALGHVREHADARHLKAGLYWDQFVLSETAGRDSDMQFYRRVVEQFDDGAFAKRLRGDGVLELRTRAFPCRCLAEGRMVAPVELNHRGYHACSGRSLAAYKGADGLPALEPAAPVRRRVHGPRCAAEDVAGAECWLFRFEEIGRLLIPCTPPGAPAGKPAPAAALDALYSPVSPFRPRGAGHYLGPTPLRDVPLPMGSYLLIVAHSRFRPCRVPIFISRCGRSAHEVTLFGEADVPAGFVAVPGGLFREQGDTLNPQSYGGKVVPVSDIFIAVHPVTCAQYAVFLNSLASVNPSQAARHSPRRSAEAGACWSGPPWAVPTIAWLAKATDAERARVSTLDLTGAPWEEDWPVAGVSWEDGMAYAAWLSEREERLFTLPHEQEWEKSARGLDHRWFPWGRHFDERWANGNRSHPGQPQPAAVHEFPHDESCYGVRGLAGNVRCACLNVPGVEYPVWRTNRGGSWGSSRGQARSSIRRIQTPQSTDPGCGIRLTSLVRVPGVDPA